MKKLIKHILNEDLSEDEILLRGIKKSLNKKISEEKFNFIDSIDIKRESTLNSGWKYSYPVNVYVINFKGSETTLQDSKSLRELERYITLLHDQAYPKDSEGRPTMYYSVKDNFKKSNIRESVSPNIKEKVMNLVEKYGIIGAIKAVGSYDDLKELLKGEEFLTRENMVEVIIQVTQEFGGLGVHEIGLEPIVIKEPSKELHTIEFISTWGCIVQVWGGYKMETDMGEYRISFDAIDTNHLYEITDGMIEYYFDNI